MNNERFIGVGLLRVLIILLFFVGHPLNANNDPTLKFMKEHAVKVEVRGVNPAVASSGFLWQQNDLVVTSLHAIPTSLHATPPVGRIIVKCVTASGETLAKRADVLKVLPKADLVLLKVKNPLNGCAPFKDARTDDPGSETLHTYGWHGALIGQPREIKRGDGGPLNELIGGEILEALARFGTPSVTEEIYAMSNGSLPGYSGAAIIDGSHRLVAIVDGGLNNGSAGYTWAIPSRYLFDLEAQPEGVTWTQPTGPVPKWLYSTALADPGDNAVLKYKEHSNMDGPPFEYEWVYTKSLSLPELANSATDAAALLNLYEAYGTEIDPNSLLFDIYEDQRYQLIIATPADQILEFEPVEGNSEYFWLKSEAVDISNGHTQYRQSNWSVTSTVKPFERIEPGDYRFFNEKISELIADCNEPGQSYCTVDPDSIRIVNFDNGDKILRVGFGIDNSPKGAGYVDSYDYYSIAVRGNLAFRAFLQFSRNGNQGPRPCDSDPNRICANPNASQLAQMIGVQLTNFANLGSTTGGRTLETRFPYDDSSDNPDTIHRGFFEDGKLRLYNSRGGIWQAYEYRESDLRTHEHYETSRDQEYVYLTEYYQREGSQHSLKVPIWGGEYFAWRDGQWQSTGSLQRK